MARSFDAESIFTESATHQLPALTSQAAKNILASAISTANSREDSLTIEVLSNTLESIASHVSKNIDRGIDIAGDITSTEPDVLDYADDGAPLQRTPREKAEDAIPRTDEEIFQPLLTIQSARDAVEEAKRLLDQGSAEKIALKNLDKAMDHTFKKTEANAYAAIAQAMKQLHRDYKRFIKQYDTQILGETRLLLNDAVTIASHAAQIAEVEHKARIASPHIGG